MNNCILITVFWLVNTLFTHAQYDTIRNGAYRNIEEFKKNNPLYTCAFEFKIKKPSPIPELYAVRSPNQKIHEKTLRYGIKFIKTDSCIYLNGYRLGMVAGYIKIYPIQTYGYFKGIPIVAIDLKNVIGNPSADPLAPLGIYSGGVSSRKIRKETKNDIHYVLNLESGMTNLLTKDYMLRLLESEPEYAYLLKMFENEEYNDTYEVCRTYLECVNHISIE